jgi:predicted HTH domain antitoxin
MAIKIELPDAIEEKLRADFGDPSAAGKEAMLVELYRQGRISHGELAEGLGLSRYETDGVLRRHNVTEDLLSREELDEQLAGLRRRLAT